MKLEQQVVSLEMAQRLKELGVKQESVSYWREFQLDSEFEKIAIWDVDTEMSYRSTISSIIQSISAFTVAELGEMLPEFVGKHSEYFLECYKTYCVPSEAGYQIRYADNNGIGDPIILHSVSEDTEANARAKMLIYLIDNNIIFL